MAGRGCTVIVQLLNPSVGDGNEAATGNGVEEISLPVALHSPLFVFKERLQELCGIDVPDQVLILCDLTDPDRNNDLLLSQDYTNIKLRDCGFKSGSVLTLHALGISAEKRQVLMKDAALKKKERQDMILQMHNNTTEIKTPISAKDADHSFNGIIFDVVSKKNHQVDVVSISLSGMLGRIRIFARNASWSKDMPSKEDSYSPYGHHPGVNLKGWTLVADQVCRPSWDRPHEIFLDEPFCILPHSRHGFYAHSGLPDDLGIQYQSCSQHEIIQDDVVALLPGLGHCGNRPFDSQSGWFRSSRVLSGSVRYRATVKGWSQKQHHLFPQELKEGVKELITCHTSARQRAVSQERDALGQLAESSGLNSFLSSRGLAAGGAKDHQDNINNMSNMNNMDNNMNNNTSNTDGGSGASALSILDERYLISYILEFCHWDWMEEVLSEKLEKGEAELPDDSFDKFVVESERRTNTFNESYRARGGRSIGGILGQLLQGGGQIDEAQLFQLMQAAQAGQFPQQWMDGDDDEDEEGEGDSSDGEWVMESGDSDVDDNEDDDDDDGNDVQWEGQTGGPDVTETGVWELVSGSGEEESDEEDEEGTPNLQPTTDEMDEEAEDEADEVASLD